MSKAVSHPSTGLYRVYDRDGNLQLVDGEVEVFSLGEANQRAHAIGGRYLPITRTYRDGQVIEYTSFDPSGYSVGQVVKYADDADQDNPADLLVLIRTRVGGRPFPVRESQLRAHAQPVAESRVNLDNALYS
jgi:hypothetical protein